MPGDRALQRRAARAKSRLDRAHAEADSARSQFHDALRELHAAGHSLREIADAFGLSHQRVHQIVGGAACSFCGARQTDGARLAAGPRVFVCDRCAALARRVVAEGRVVSDEFTALEPVPADAAARCSFCRRRAHRAGPMAARGQTRICHRCVAFGAEVMTPP